MPRLTHFIGRKAAPWLAAFGSLLTTAAFAALPTVPPAQRPPATTSESCGTTLAPASGWPV